MAFSRYIFDVIDTLLDELSPRQIAAGVTLGLFLAVSPWLTAQGVALLLVATLVRVNLPVTVASFLIFRLAVWFFEYGLDSLGMRMLTGYSTSTAVWAWAYNAPVLPFTYFYNSVVMAGSALALVAAAPLFIVTLLIARRHWKRGIDRMHASRWWGRWRRSGLFARHSRGISRNPYFRRVAVPPLLFAALASTIYVTLFLDANLAQFLEGQLSFYNAAKVDIGKVTTRLWRGTVDIAKLEITDPLSPNHNLLEIDEIHLVLRPSLFLRKKVLVDDMQVYGVHYHSPRKHSGVLPFETTYGMPTIFDRSGTDSFPSLALSLGDNPFRHVMRLVANPAEIENLIARHRAALDATKRLGELAGELQKISEDRKPASAAPDTEHLRRSALALDATIEPDTQRIWDKLGLARLEDDDYTRFLFGPRLLSSLERTQYWVNLARRYMPKALQQGLYTLTIQPRAHGTSVHYGGIGGTPALMLVHASFESTADAATRRGRVSGSLANLNTDPAICNCRTTLDLEADFPDSGVTGARVSMLIDHTRFNFHESLRIGVDAFPLHDFMISHTDDFSLAIAKATGTLILFGQFDDEQVRAEAKLRVQSAQYDVKSTSPELADEVQETVAGTPEFILHTAVEGPVSDVKLTATSELGHRIADGFLRDYHDRLVSLRRNVRHALTDGLDARREKFLTELAAVTGRAARP